MKITYVTPHWKSSHKCLRSPSAIESPEFSFILGHVVRTTAGTIGRDWHRPRYCISRVNQSDEPVAGSEMEYVGSDRAVLEPAMDHVGSDMVILEPAMGYVGPDRVVLEPAMEYVGPDRVVLEAAMGYVGPDRVILEAEM